MYTSHQVTQVRLQEIAQRLREDYERFQPPKGAPAAPEVSEHLARLEEEMSEVAAAQRPPGARLVQMVGGVVKQWPPGAQVLHLYGRPRLTPDLAEVLALHRGVDPALIAPVQDPWLHLTVSRIDALAVGDPRVDVLAAALGEALAGEDGAWSLPVTAELSRSGTILTSDPQAPAAVRMRQAAEAAARAAGVPAKYPARPHVSTGYCTPAGAALEGARVAELSDQIGVRHLELTLAALEVAWVRQNPAVPTYTWHTHSLITLAST